MKANFFPTFIRNGVEVRQASVASAGSQEKTWFGDTW